MYANSWSTISQIKAVWRFECIYHCKLYYDCRRKPDLREGSREGHGLGQLGVDIIWADIEGAVVQDCQVGAGLQRDVLALVVGALGLAKVPRESSLQLVQDQLAELCDDVRDHAGDHTW